MAVAVTLVGAWWFPLLGVVAGLDSFSPPTPTQGIPHGPILIEGDAGLTSSNGVTGGSGTIADPFVLEGWDVDARASTGIEVRNTSAHFVIRNSTVASSFGAFDGVRLRNVSNARFEGLGSWLVRVGMYLRDVRNVTITQSSFAYGYDYAIDVIGAEDLGLWGNLVENNVYPARIESAANLTVISNTVRHNNGTFTAAGFHLRKITGGVMKGNTISWNNGDAVSLEESTGVSIEDNELLGGRYEGISSVSSTGGAISNNRLSNYGLRGISLRNARNLTLAGNSVLDSGEGIRLDEGVNITLSANSVAPGGVILSGSSLAAFNSHTIAADNLVNDLPLLFAKDCANPSIRGVSIGQLILVNCTGANVADLAFRSSVGIQLAYVNGATIENVSLESAVGLGIVAFHVADLRLRRIEVSGLAGMGISIAEGSRVEIDATSVPSGGISLWAVTDGTVNGSSVGSYVWGIVAQQSRNLSISHNSVTRSTYGIFLEDVSRGSVADNAIDSDTFYRGTGVEVRGSQDIIVNRNNISRNYVGVRLDGSTGVRVDHNRFSYNSDSAEDSGGTENSWDAGYPLGGNYWADYTGSDNCGGPDQRNCTGRDGIGDVPYVIDIDSADRFPLLEASPINDPPVSLILAPEGPVFVNDTVVFDFEGSDPDGRIVLFEWDLGDGTQGESQTNPPPIEHRYQAPNSYLVTLTVTDDRGAISVASVEIEVRAGSSDGLNGNRDTRLSGLAIGAIGVLTIAASSGVVVALVRSGRPRRPARPPPEA